MAPISPRRGMIRPISDLPVSADASLIEVEDADGTARQMPIDDISGGLPFPDDPTAYGVQTDDDEEWDGPETITERGWTVETNPASGNTLEVNGTFSPSRLRLNVSAVTNDLLSAYRALAAVNPADDISVTFDVAGVFDQDFKFIECGFRDQAAAAGAKAETAILGHTTLNPGGGNVAGSWFVKRAYTNIGTAAFTEQRFLLVNANASPTVGRDNVPRRVYLHLQRVGASWSMYVSPDGSTWKFIQGADGNVFTPNFLWIRMGGGGAGDTYKLANDWIRLNRGFPP